MKLVGIHPRSLENLIVSSMNDSSFRSIDIFVRLGPDDNFNLLRPCVRHCWAQAWVTSSFSAKARPDSPADRRSRSTFFLTVTRRAGCSDTRTTLTLAELPSSSTGLSGSPNANGYWRMVILPLMCLYAF
jgi:hypothetical protein